MGNNNDDHGTMQPMRPFAEKFSVLINCAKYIEVVEKEMKITWQQLKICFLHNIQVPDKRRKK